VSALRVATVGGLLSFRGLFNWLHPAIFVPALVVPPIFQVVFFAYLGRAAKLETDSFYVVGNSIQLAALPGLFVMSQAITGERRSQTLTSLLGSPASRLALLLGRTIPVLALSLFVSLTSFGSGVLLLEVDLDAAVLPPLVLTMLSAAWACTALGIVQAAMGLRVREMAVFSNLVFAVLLVFCGVNVPLESLPDWMRAVAEGLPVTHAVEAARRLVAGDPFTDVAHLVAVELGIGVAYLLPGLGLLRYYEREARRHASLDLV